MDRKEIGNDELKFAELVREQMLRQYEGLKITVTTTKKKNGVINTGLELSSEKDAGICPFVRTDGYMEKYREGMTLEQIAVHIMGIYLKDQDSRMQMDVKDLADFGKIQHRIGFMLINTEKNREMLKRIPCRQFHDLSMIYEIFVGFRKDKVGTVTVTDKMMEHWQKEEEDLYGKAIKNMEIMFPPDIRPMNKLLEKMALDMGTLTALEAADMGKEESIYILTNSEMIQGAGTILYHEMPERIWQFIGNQDYFILPSSVHELLILPVREGIKKEGILQIIREVNRACVPATEFLSDNLYLYHGDTGEIEMIEQQERIGTEE